jgi:hypothetical protein
VDTTTQTRLYHEDATRLLSLTSDISAEQTERINREKARRAAGHGPDEERLDFIREKHRTAQRLLKPYTVVIPYAEYLNIPSEMTSARRSFDHLLSCIQAVALLRQGRKTVDGGQIFATHQDYRVVYELMVPVLRRALGGADQRSLELGKMIAAQANAKPFGMAEITEWSGLKRTTANDHLKPLVEAGVVREVPTGDGRKKMYEITTPVTDASFGLAGLVTPDRLEQIVKCEGLDRGMRRRSTEDRSKPRPR